MVKEQWAGTLDDAWMIEYEIMHQWPVEENSFARLTIGKFIFQAFDIKQQGSARKLIFRFLFFCENFDCFSIFVKQTKFLCILLGK